MLFLTLIPTTALTIGESDTPFGFAVSRTEVGIIIMILAIFLFYIIIKIYDVVKRKHWKERQNRIKAVRKVLNKCQKNLDEIETEDLIAADLVTLYDFYDRSIDKLCSDLEKDFPKTEDEKEA